MADVVQLEVNVTLSRLKRFAKIKKKRRGFTWSASRGTWLAPPATMMIDTSIGAAEGARQIGTKGADRRRAKALAKAAAEAAQVATEEQQAAIPEQPTSAAPSLVLDECLGRSEPMASSEKA